MKKAIFDWLCSLLIDGTIYFVIIIPFMILLLIFVLLYLLKK